LAPLGGAPLPDTAGLAANPTGITMRACRVLATRQLLTNVEQAIQFELMSAIQFAPSDEGEHKRIAPRKFVRDEILRALAQTRAQ
jgi:hypothetical protein